jgi:acyl transferase domain-containing protein
VSEQLQQMQELLQKSLVKIKKLESELEAKSNEQLSVAYKPVAIIGTGVRLAEGINSTEKLWQLLIEQKSAVSKIPDDRFNVDEIYDADYLAVGKTNSKYGAFLQNDVRAFDAEFFGISPREAKSVDPLQRMILEVVYESLETAGIASESLKGTETGVFIALGNSDYIQARFRSGNLDTVDVYDATGIPFGTACGRVSYLYDFKGTSFSLDAACASSLLSVHLACEELQKKTIETAIVVSANLLLTPEPFVGLTKLGSLSGSNECRAFDNNADGYIRGEGCGVVILKRLEDAEKDNNNIEVIIKGASVKHNGTSNGFTAPNPAIQMETIKEALKNANLKAADIDYVEAHGIGNKFTDAIEIQSINDGYAERDKPLYIGSVKANIGHLEAGTGMPMLFKIIETLKHKKIPAQINITTLNDDVQWNKINAKVSTQTIDWKRNDNQPLRAAINLSGYSGTNVHMIFEEAKPKKQSDEINAPYDFIVSAKNEISLKKIAQKYLDEPAFLENQTLSEICYTLQKGRNHFEYALGIVAHTKQDITDGLMDFLQEKKSLKYAVSNTAVSRNQDITFLFTGQGAQYFGMCKGYYESFDVFRNATDECDEILQQHLDISVKDILWNETVDKSLINQTKYTQPALFVVEYALSKLWISFGIQPSSLIGHSIGEISALCVANAISLKDALQLVVARAALMNSLPLNVGGMASVFCNEETIKPFLENTNIDLAAINSVKNCTVSGKKEDVQALLEVLKENKIKAIQLIVSHAFHSALMEPVLEKFTAFANQISFKQPEIKVISNLTGKEITKTDLNADYFASHIRNAVQFSNGIEYLRDKLNSEIYLEVGPNPVLVSLGKQTNTNVNTLWLSSAKKDENDVQYFHESLVQLYCAGIAVNWNQLYQNKKLNTVKLPTYGWNWKVYWENPVFRKKSADDRSQLSDKYKNNESANKEHRPKSLATRENLLAYMQIEAAKVLGLEAGQNVDINKTYREQGFDSMMSGEFLTLMEKHIGAELKMEIIAEHNTPKDLHRYLIDTFYGGGEIDTTQAVTMADVMFNQEMEHTFHGDWHEIQPGDSKLLRWFKKFDKKIPGVK